MSKWAIVAIPSEQDYVWKISSEKVPHMTLLFLGEQEGNPHEVDIASFIKHAVDTTIERFGMDVDRRGTLGPDQADVLFFNKKGYGGASNMEAFRNVLLQDQNIFEAHNSTTQYDGWVPHLTLGYPATPAHPDERDYPGISWVNFDKIALWTSDSEGYEFLLKEQELAMSDLAHYGIPGMKWGKHRTKSSVSTGRTLLVGALGNSKARYKDPEALAMRTKAGHKAALAFGLGAGGNLISALGKNSAGAMAVSTVLNAGAGGVGVASLVQAFQANALERRSEGR